MKVEKIPTDKDGKISCVVKSQIDCVKFLLHSLIQSRNYKEFVQQMELHDVDPHEEISVEGYNWTCLHYAAHFNAASILEYLIKRAFDRNKERFLEIINTQTIEGWSPLMIAVIFKSYQCLEVLLKYGGCHVDLTDKTGKTAAKLAECYGSYECLKALKGQGTGILPVKYQYLIEDQHQDFEKDPELEELLINGVLKPCVYCYSNLGYLKYCKLCGCPIHTACLAEHNTTCPACKTMGTVLTSEVTYPFKAFTLE